MDAPRKSQFQFVSRWTPKQGNKSFQTNEVVNQKRVDAEDAWDKAVDF